MFPLTASAAAYSFAVGTSESEVLQAFRPPASTYLKPSLLPNCFHLASIIYFNGIKSNTNIRRLLVLKIKYILVIFIYRTSSKALS